MREFVLCAVAIDCALGVHCPQNCAFALHHRNTCVCTKAPQYLFAVAALQTCGARRVTRVGRHARVALGREAAPLSSLPGVSARLSRNSQGYYATPMGRTLSTDNGSELSNLTAQHRGARKRHKRQKRDRSGPHTDHGTPRRGKPRQQLHAAKPYTTTQCTVPRTTTHQTNPKTTPPIKDTRRKQCA